MLKIFISGLLLAAVIAEPIRMPVQTDSDDTLYVVNGTVAKEHDNRHVCDIRSGGEGFWRHHCGASIISEEWAITAAHCLKYLKADGLTLKCGSLNKTDPNGQVFKISELIVHPNFTSQTLDSDVGLIKIEGKFHLDSKPMNKIALPEHQDEPVPVDSVVTVSGWGSTAMDDDLRHMESDVLLTVSLPVVANEVCDKAFRHLTHTQTMYPKITNHMLCAGGVELKSGCHGDSGGPLTQDGKLVGLVSWGYYTCARIGIPNVFTRVASLRNWIRENSGV